VLWRTGLSTIWQDEAFCFENGGALLHNKDLTLRRATRLEDRPPKGKRRQLKTSNELQDLFVRVA
jgi:hypothetical protein